MIIRTLATGLTAAVALLCSVPTEAAVINGTDFTNGQSNQVIQGITFTASGGTFQQKTLGVPTFTGVGVSGLPTTDEIDIGESITGTRATPFNVDSITLGVLFDGPEFNDVNEVAQISINGVPSFTLTATFLNAACLNAVLSGPGTVTNLSPATPTGGAVWLLTGLNLTNVTSISFTPLTGVC